MNNYKSRTVQQLIAPITVTITVFNSFIYYQYLGRLENNSQTSMLRAFGGRHPNPIHHHLGWPTGGLIAIISLQFIWIWPIHTALDPQFWDFGVWARRGFFKLPFCCHQPTQLLRKKKKNRVNYLSHLAMCFQTTFSFHFVQGDLLAHLGFLSQDGTFGFLLGVQPPRLFLLVFFKEWGGRFFAFFLIPTK